MSSRRSLATSLSFEVNLLFSTGFLEFVVSRFALVVFDGTEFLFDGDVSLFGGEESLFGGEESLFC